MNFLKPLKGYYMQNGREKKLRDRDRFDGEDLDFRDTWFERQNR